MAACGAARPTFGKAALKARLANCCSLTDLYHSLIRSQKLCHQSPVLSIVVLVELEDYIK